MVAPSHRRRGSKTQTTVSVQPCRLLKPYLPILFICVCLLLSFVMSTSNHDIIACVSGCARTFPDHSHLTKHAQSCKVVLDLKERANKVRKSTRGLKSLLSKDVNAPKKGLQSLQIQVLMTLLSMMMSFKILDFLDGKRRR